MPGISGFEVQQFHMSAMNMRECESYTLTVCGEDLITYLSTFSNIIDDEEDKDLIFLYLNLSQNLRTYD